MACSPGKAVAKAAQEHQLPQLARDLQVRSRPCASSGQPSVQANADWRPLMPAYASSVAHSTTHKAEAPQVIGLALRAAGMTAHVPPLMAHLAVLHRAAGGGAAALPAAAPPQHGPKLPRRASRLRRPSAMTVRPCSSVRKWVYEGAGQTDLCMCSSRQGQLRSR